VDRVVVRVRVLEVGLVLVLVVGSEALLDSAGAAGGGAPGRDVLGRRDFLATG
jgi:hypothetical protein